MPKQTPAPKIETVATDPLKVRLISLTARLVEKILDQQPTEPTMERRRNIE